MRNGLFTAAFLLLSVVTAIAQVNTILQVDDDIRLIRLHDSVYVHVTWDYHENFGRFSSNGLILIRNGQALMVDTPTDNEKTERLTIFIRDSLSAELTTLIIGHFHDDCLGGLQYLHQNEVTSIANTRTVSKCRELGLPVPKNTFTDSLRFDFGGTPVLCRYFGAGHTADNITVWFSEYKLLFGGCLIKSADSGNLGNLSDAVVSDWDQTVERLRNAYAHIETVIPGHGDFGGSELLSHTINLVQKEKNK